MPLGAHQGAEKPPVKWLTAVSPEQLRRLGQAADRIMSRIDTSEIN